MRFHLEMKAQTNVENGMSLQEAHRDAMRRFGNMTRMQEKSREIWLFRTFELLLQDLRFAARVLMRQPGFTVVAAVALALGIGANTAIFSVVNTVLLKPLPYPESDRLVWLAETSDVANRWVSYLNFRDWRDRNHSFESMSVYRHYTMTLTGNGEPESVVTQMVAGEYFKVMRANPIFGRTFTIEDEKISAQVVVISYNYWQNHFGADAGIVGKSIALDGMPFVVIGIMPREFQQLEPMPMWVLTGGQWAQAGLNKRDTRTGGFVVGRLKTGVTLYQARSDLVGISAQLIKEYPKWNMGQDHITMMSLYDYETGDIKPVLWILFAAVGFVLLIACSNVANLLMARAAGRQREIALRVALGASRWRVIRQLLTENLILAMIGGTSGLILAWWGLRLFSKMEQSLVPRAENLHIDLPVLGFTLLLSMLTGIVFGLIPALQSSKVNLDEALKESSRTTSDSRSGRLGATLVVVEVALSLMLLIGSGLLIKSLDRMVKTDTGFEAENVLTMTMSLPKTRYKLFEGTAIFQQRLLERVSVLPGVSHASISNNLPGFSDGWQTDIFPEGHAPIKPGELINVDWSIVSHDYFNTMKIPILSGRTFTPEEDQKGRNVVLVDETLARKFWPNEDAVGKHLKYDSPDWQEIIGVVKQVKFFGSEDQPRIKIYTPLGRDAYARFVLSVKTSHVDPQSMAGTIIGAIHSLDKDLPVAEVATMQQLLDRQASPKRFNTILFGIFAAVALILAAVGIYGVMSYSVAQRTHEIGVRMALGAQKGDVLKMILGQGMTRIIVGIVIGLSGATALTGLMKKLLFGVSATDPMTFAVVPVLLIFVALFACYIPARRATRMDPTVALRYD